MGELSTKANDPGKTGIRFGLSITVVTLMIVGFGSLSLTIFEAECSGEWTNFRGDERNWGYSDRTVTEKLNITWDVELGKGWIDPTPAIQNGKVYVFTNGDYDFSSGKQVSSSTIVCLRERTGEKIWSQKVSDSKVQLSSPSLGNEMIAVGSSDGSLHVFNSTSGESLFTFQCGRSVYGITSSPLFVKDRIIFGGGDGVVYCLDTSGNRVWSYDTGNTIYLSSCASSEGRIYIGNDGGNLSCIELAKGTLLWSHHVDGRIRTSPLIMDDGILFSWSTYSGNVVTDGWLRAITSDGMLSWEEHMGGTISSPGTDGRNVFVGNNEGLFICYDLNGEKKWSFRANGPIQSSSAVAANGVFFTSNINMSGNHSTLYFLDKEGGVHFSHEIEPHQWAMSSPVIGNGCVVFASDNGHVYCISDGTFDSHGPDEKPENDGSGNGKNIPGGWMHLGMIVLIVIFITSVTGRAEKGKNGKDACEEKISRNLAYEMRDRIENSRRYFMVKICVLSTVVIILSAGIAISLHMPGIGSKGEKNEVDNITIIIDFGAEKGPVNPENLTTWEFDGEKWNVTISPSDNTVWRFMNVSSSSGTVLDCLVNALEIVDGEIVTSQYIYGTFVASIAGIENGRNELNWLYWVNDDYANMASNVYYLEKGDVVLWKYTKNV